MGTGRDWEPEPSSLHVVRSTVAPKYFFSFYDSRGLQLTELLVNNLRIIYRFGAPRHLICFKDWTPIMVMDILVSALNLKCRHRDTHNKRLETLANSKVMILQEINEPVLNLAVSKAATFLGATDVNITDNLIWDYDYNGSIFALMTDAIFVSTTKHMCVQRFAEKSPVPVLCMKSRTHSSIQSLATVMAIMEEFGTMKCINVSYLGPPHPILNSYLLLCPMLGANIKFKCCCKECPVSPLLFKASEDMTSAYGTETKQCPGKNDALDNASVIISGPTAVKKDKVVEFKICEEDITQSTSIQNWIYFHTCPRGQEVDDILFYNCHSRTFVAFDNMQYIAAALMAYCIKGITF